MIGNRYVLLDSPESFAYVNHGRNVHNHENWRAFPASEHDACFLPNDPLGLAAHMDRVRGAVEAWS